MGRQEFKKQGRSVGRKKIFEELLHLLLLDKARTGGQTSAVLTSSSPSGFFSKPGTSVLARFRCRRQPVDRVVSIAMPSGVNGGDIKMPATEKLDSLLYTLISIDTHHQR